MTYISIYDPNVNPDRPRAVDLVRYRTADHETDFLFDLRGHFRNQYLVKDAYEEHLLATTAALGADELATEFALLLLTTLEPGWDTDDRTSYWSEGERSALMAHAIAHPYEWNLVGGGLVRDLDRKCLVRVELRERGGRLVIVALDPDRGYGGEYVPLGNMARHLSSRGLYSTLFSMLPAIAEHMVDEPDWDVWGSVEAYEAVVDPTYFPDDAPYRKVLRVWQNGAEETVDAAVECAAARAEYWTRTIGRRELRALK